MRRIIAIAIAAALTCSLMLSERIDTPPQLRGSIYED